VITLTERYLAVRHARPNQIAVKPAAATLAILTGCAGTFSGPHRAATRSPALLALAEAATAADTATTIWMSDGARWNGRVREGDPLLGATPSMGMLLGAFGLAAAGEWAAWRYLHQDTVVPVIGIEAAMAANNAILATTGGRSM
jgi:hypothetical protein